MPTLTGGETEAQSSYVVCPRSHGSSLQNQNANPGRMVPEPTLPTTALNVFKDRQPQHA